MIINVDDTLLDELVRKWLVNLLEELEPYISADLTHPEDRKHLKKDVKAIKRVLDFAGGIL